MLAGSVLFLNAFSPGGNGRAPGRQVLEGEVLVLDDPVTVRVATAEIPARLSDLVPLARALADGLIGRARQRLVARGRPITCRPRCAACCRYLVPLSAPEALRLGQEIERLPAGPRQRILESFAAARQAIASRPPEAHAAADAVEAVARWYGALQLDCPFLLEDLCSVYAGRPLACREHLVTSPARQCRASDPDAGEPVELGFSVLETLGRLAAEMAGTGLESVMLPLALEWAAGRAPRDERTWPAPALVERLLALLESRGAPCEAEALAAGRA